jgi:hypothetical protein
MSVSLAAFVAAGCANQQPTRSGFLTGYGDLKPSGSGTTLASDANSSRLSAYRALVVLPVETRLGPDIDAAAARDLAQRTETALKRELGKEWPLVAAPGPGVLIVRSALTKVRKSSPAANVVLTVVAVPLINGGLSAEAEWLDGKSRRQVGALAWADEGRINPVGYYSELGHPKALVDDFAKVLASRLSRKN